MVLQTQDENGNPVPYATYITGDPTAVLPTSMMANGESQAIILTANPEDASQLTGETLLPEFEGENVIGVDIDVTGYDHNLYTHEGVPASVSFTREDSLMTDPDFWNALKWAFIALMAILAAVIVYLRTNPVKGVLQFSSAAGTYRISLYTGWRFSNVTPNPAVRKAISVNRVKANKVKTGGGNARARINLVTPKGVRSMDMTSEGNANVFDTWQVTYTGGGMDSKSGGIRRPGGGALRGPARPPTRPPQPGTKKKGLFGR